ncbi:RTA1 domain protein [Zymoseptoria brevis]|uniref:RTA1 domain protein n=1 Tax=Zymoseptoria brevis TaxID=1047168 RepID=A0A0F4GAX7_9PEZI|nr:RTA1 domain protein [Zymoseptoria brevis]
MNAATDDGRWLGLPYHPNAAAAIIFIATFGLATLGHIGHMFWMRTWYFIPLLIERIMETFGYYGRFWLSRSPTNFKAYVLYDLLVLPAPIFLAATIYMSLSRIIIAPAARDLSPVRPSRMSKWFIFGDVVCFLVQLAGVGMGVTPSRHIQELGAKVVVVGLVFQILVFALFISAAVTFYRRYESHVGPDSGPLKWRRYLISLLTASGCIVIRNIVRGVEHAQNSDGSIALHEVFVYLFDALLMLCVVIVMLACHPGYLQRSSQGKSASDVERNSTITTQTSLMRETILKGHRPRPCSYPRERD